MGTQYQFEYAEGTPYFNVVQLGTAHFESGGVVLDIGCGFGAAAEPFRNAGYDYVGVDMDDSGPAALRERGYEAYTARLDDPAQFQPVLAKALKGRKLSGILLLDVLEHVTDPVGTLRDLHELAKQHGNVPLLMCVPHVAHFDIAAKLLSARWDITETGLLDVTHIGFYTDHGLANTAAAGGWREVERNDFSMGLSDQAFPADHVAVRPGTSLREFLLGYRRACSPDADVNQFIRVYATADPIPFEFSDRNLDDSPTFTVVVPLTNGSQALDETMLSLAGQTDTSFELVLVAAEDDEVSSAAARTYAAAAREQSGQPVRAVLSTDGSRAISAQLRA